jgi:hypothetical protein
MYAEGSDDFDTSDLMNDLMEEVNTINTRVLESPTGPKASDIPADATYATASNLDRVAINDGIFAKHLASTHSKNPNVDPPKHTICIKTLEFEMERRW